MVITAILPRRKGLCQLCIDGELAMKVDAQTVANEGICVGMELSDEALHILLQKSDKRRANEKALNLLAFRSHSKKELEDKIAATAAPRETAKAAVNRMEELGLVDDRVYAAQLVETLFRKRYGLNRIKQALMQKGISREVAEETLEAYRDIDYAAQAREALERKYPAYAQDEKVKRRAFAGLQRMGYSFDQIRAAMAMDEDFGA